MANPFRYFGSSPEVIRLTVMLFVFAIAVALVVLLVRWLWFGHTSDGAGRNVKSALTNLEERFARGEIDKEEFEEKKRMIGS